MTEERQPPIPSFERGDEHPTVEHRVEESLPESEGLAEATPTAYKEISRFAIQRNNFPTWTPPVISGGRMYLREQDNLYSYNIAEK